VNVDGNHQYWIDILVVKGDTVTFVNTHDGDNQSLEPHCISDPYAVPYTEESCWIIDGSTPSRSYTMTETQTFYDRFFDVPPITVTVVEKQSNTGDGTMEAHVYGTPFDVTVLEGGSITFTNQGTSTWNFISYGWFEVTVEPASSVTIDLPIENCATTCFFADPYYVKDLATGTYNTIHIVKPIVVEPVITPVVEKQSNTGDGTMEAHVYGIPFDVKIMEGGKVVYHNNDPMFHHDLQHTGTVGTEKGGTFSMWAGSNGGTATANFPVENCSSCYPAGVYSWKDSVSGITGTITILADENTVNEQVGIQEDIVVVLKKSELSIQSNSTETADSVLDKTKNFKTQIEAKINAKIEPLKTEIVNLKEELANNENDRLILDEQKEKLTKQINLLRQNATISETKYLEESKINKDLRGKISTLESQAVDTIELEKYRKDAANWKGVALEQLRVMGEILGLF
jgi:hypothetical protein